MSQKINGNLPVTASVRSSAVSGKVSSSGSAVTAATPTDSLSLTGEANQLQATQRSLSQAPAVDGSRVQAVRDSLQNGSYRIDPDNIANRMQSLDRQLVG